MLYKKNDIRKIENELYNVCNVCIMTKADKMNLLSLMRIATSVVNATLLKGE